MASEGLPGKEWSISALVERPAAVIFAKLCLMIQRIALYLSSFGDLSMRSCHSICFSRFPSLSQHPSWVAAAIAVFSLSSVFAGITGFADDPWPQFRGPAGNGIAASSTVPLEFSPTQNLLWRCELPGEGWSSPVVGEDAIYVSAAIPKEQAKTMALSVLEIDPETGKLRSEIEVFEQPEDAPGIHQKNSHASPTLWLENERIFAHFGHQGTAALNRGGEVLWTNRDLTFPPVHGNGGSPIVVGDLLIFTCDGAEEGYVAALDIATGKLRWKTGRPVDAPRKFSFCTPTAIEVDGQVQVICPGSDCVLALDPKNGSIIWQVLYDGYSVVPKPIYAEGLVYVATGFGPTAVMAIEPTGRGDVTESHVQWKLEKSAPKTPSLIVDQGLLYVISDDGIFTVVEAKTGDLVYRKRVGGNYSASPVLIQDRIYLSSEEGIIRVVRTGKEFEILAENDLGERTLATPAIFDNSIVIRTAKALYRFQ